MTRLEIHLDGTWHDITPLYVMDTLTLQLVAFNSEHRSSVSSCSFLLRYDQRLYDAVMAEHDQIPVRIWSDMDVDFLGYMDPVLDTDWDRGQAPETLAIECVDFSVLLDVSIPQSATYPAKVGQAPYWIWRRDQPGMSILYRLLELADLVDRIDRAAPDIDQQIRHIAWTKETVTIRSVIDSLLADYGWCLTVHGDKLTWQRTAVASLGILEDIGPGDIVGSMSKSKDYVTENGVTVVWPKVKVMDDALLWRGNLPIGDTSNPRPGEAIAGGDYWPEDSDVIETWMDFGTEYLDTDWLEGRTRIRNEELALVSSSDWVLTDSRDDEVVLDPIEEGVDVVYEALRARLRYHNTAQEASRLYWSQINGKALVKTTSVTTRLPADCTKPQTYQTSHIYDQESADRLARIRLMWMRSGSFSFSLSSTRRLTPGGFYHLHQCRMYEGPVQVMSASIQAGSPTLDYVLVSTAAFSDVLGDSTSSGSQGSGGVTPGQDGASWTYIYIRSHQQPATPVGDSPAGWSIGAIPAGHEPVWMSAGKFSSTGNLIGSWTTPVRVSGDDNGAYRGAVDSVPTDPVDGDFILYTGPTSGDFIQYHIYKYVAIDDQWVETLESDKVMMLQKDALDIARDTGTLIYAAAIFVELLVTRKLMVGGGTETQGLLLRFLDDDGTGKPLIEIRHDGQRLFYLDMDTGKLYGNFARVVQYLPYQFNDSLDTSHPAIFDFYIPDGEIVWIRIRVKAQKFRTYSTATEAMGNVTTRSSIFGNGIDVEYRLTRSSLSRIETEAAGAHSHTYTTPRATASGKASLKASGETAPFGDGRHDHSSANPKGTHSHSIEVTVQDNGHTHALKSTTGNTGNASAHTHSLTGYELTRTGSYSHEHIVDISHGHSLVLGIIEGATASGMTLAFDNKGNGSFSSPVSIASGAEVTKDSCPALGSATPGGWKSLRITSSSLGRVQVNMTIKMRIDTDDDL